MIFNDIDILAPPQGPRGRGQKKCAVARSIYVSNSHTKFGWISSNGLGGASVRDGQTDQWTDRWKDGSDCNIPDAFLKKCGDNNNNKKKKTKGILLYLEDLIRSQVNRNQLLLQRDMLICSSSGTCRIII